MTDTRTAAKTDDLDDPFPLKARFQRRFLPAFAVFIAVVLLALGLTAGAVIESIYLELAQRRAQTIARAVADAVPEAWSALMSGSTLNDLADGGHAAGLGGAFATEVRQLDLSELKVYDLERRVLYATHADEIGTTENGAALRAVIASATSGIVSKTLADGTEQYELYVPVFGAGGELRAVFELYEPVGYLNAIVLRAGMPILGVTGVLFVIFGIALNRLVVRAQGDIDARTAAINGLRRRIESFVSASAVGAARRAGAASDIRSEKVETTLFFSDVRDFTGFSERNPPERVVDFLNRIMGMQVETIERFGGDVDKMIGDAVLARFDGADGGARAVAAARDVLDAVAAGGYERPLGIGVYRGPVISGAIGPAQRRDFTVIGDTVNIAARLCSAAAAGELVVDAALADAAFGAEERITVKGRRQPLAVRRQRIG